jgi:hypothetical protein
VGGEGSDLAALLPVSAGGVCAARHARRPHEPRRAQGAVRGPLSAAADHGGRALAVHRHAPPLGARDRRPTGAGSAALRAAAAADLAGVDGLAGQHHVDAVPGHRPRPDPGAARPLVRLAVRAAGDRGGARVRGERTVARARELRRLPGQAPRVPAVLRRGQLVLPGGGPGGDEDPPRVRAWALLQALRRRVPRDGDDAAGVHPLPLLRRVGQLDAAEQVEAGGDRRGGDVCRGDHRLDRHLPLVELAPRRVQPALPRRDVRLQRVHDPVQREPTAPVRRLLHPLRRAGDPQPPPEGQHDPPAARLAVVSGHQAAGRSPSCRSATSGCSPSTRSPRACMAGS